MNAALTKIVNAARPIPIVKDGFDKLPTSPTILNGIMDTWPSFGKWSLKFFRDEFADRVVIGEKQVEGQLHRRPFTMSSFFQYMNAGTDERPYGVRTELHLSLSEPFEYHVEDIIPCWYRDWNSRFVPGGQKIKLSDLFFGPKGSYSHLHRDIWDTGFWNALFEGRKLWLFFDSSDFSKIYDGNVNPFSPDLEKYPLYREASPSFHIQEPGEIVYCPSNAFHAVFALEHSLALSENFINASNYQNVLKFFEKSGMNRAHQKLSAIVKFFG